MPSSERAVAMTPATVFGSAWIRAGCMTTAVAAMRRAMPVGVTTVS